MHDPEYLKRLVLDTIDAMRRMDEHTDRMIEKYVNPEPDPLWWEFDALKLRQMCEYGKKMLAEDCYKYLGE